jgi:hypothetical protein
MGEIVNIQSKKNLPTAVATSGVEMSPNLKASTTSTPTTTPSKVSTRVPPTLVDATAAFTFSRLPREQRIAQTLYDIVKPMLRSSVIGVSEEEESINQVLLVNNWPDLRDAALELAKYSVKDFAVRYGHLED